MNATIAKRLGVTPAGLAYLAKLVANPMKATKRGSESVRLIRDGLIAETDLPRPIVGGAGVYYRSGNVTHSDGVVSPAFTVTDAGREIVRRAREMGW
jgi:hypothetical protein